ncbi:MAG: hypothetical protein M1562_03250 [Candidatus Marsarchaeota archaeon]|jgi:hypothetical protein|nr:hypothetical protein [Candidatus Marsarchaeota archaeon]
MTREIVETRRSLIRWLALSFGIINPGETRLGALSVFDAVLYFQFNKKRESSIPELMEYIGDKWSGMNEKTLRYHLLQLKNLGILKNSKGRYSMVDPEKGDRYDEAAWVDSYFTNEINPIQENLKSAIKELKRR